MVVSMSTILLVRTEIQAAKAGECPDLAQSAAMSGLLFYQTLLTSTDTTFLTGAANNRKRLHFLSLTNRNRTNVTGQQIAVWTGPTPSFTYSTVATSAWMYPNGTSLWNSDCPDTSTSSIFMLKTYAYEDNGGKLASYVFVKALGCYREIEEDMIVASHYCQLNARLLIDPVARTVDIEKMRKMIVQYPDTSISSFATSLPAPW